MTGFYFILLILVIAAGAIPILRWLGGFVRSDIILDKIEKLLGEKNFSEALNIGLKFLKKNPSSYTLLQNIAKAYEGLFQYRHAIELYEKSLIFLSKESNTYLRHDICNKLGELYTSIGENNNALGYYNLVLKENMHNMKALFYSAKLLFSQKQLQKSRERLEIYLKSRPKEISPLLLLANIYYEQGEFQKSLGILSVINSQSDELISLREDEILILQAKNQIALKSYSKALPYLKNLLDKGLLVEEVLPLYIISLIRDKKINSAMIIFNDNQSIISSEKKKEVMYEIAQALFEAGEIYQALDIWKKISEMSPNYLDIKDILFKYKVLFNNLFLKNYFTTDEIEFQEYILKKFHASMNSIIEKNRDYWILKNGREAVILYRKADQISLDTLNKISDTLKGNSLYGILSYIYTLYGVDESCREYTFYKSSKEMSGKEFVDFFNSENSIVSEGMGE